MDTFKVFLHSRPSIDTRLESRYSFFNNNATKVTGVRLGLSFRRKLRVGVGYSWLDTDVSDKLLITDAYGNARVTDNHLKFGYICYYADFVFHKTKRWQLSVPIQVGTGMYWSQYNDGLNTIKSKKRLLLFYEPGITVQFKITQWCGLGLDVCARLALRNTNYVSDKLNSFVLAPKLLIWFDQIFYLAAPKSKITKKYGPAYW
ncbi:MAG: hypothetical protein HY062_02605 [Bacteroidetes bacterium]|nr:hypothetical protein [Bacteroidota bacterium]